MVAICTAELDQKFKTHLLERVIRELNNMGYYVIVFGSDSDMYRLNESDIADASVFDLIHFNMVDLVILFSETIKQISILNHIVKKAHNAGVPVISVERELDDCFNVIYDTDTAFEKLVRHIVEYHGLKEVNFISGTKGNEVAERRLEIYRDVLEDNDILFEESRVGYGDFWFGPTRQVMEQFIQPNKMMPEAIICANDSMAVTVCDFLRERNIKVPEDILVGGIDGIDEGIKHTPSITTCVRDDVRDAKTIASLVDDLCDGKTISATTVLEYHMQLAQSCGCQGKHLFDSDVVIQKLKLELEAYHADLRDLSHLAEDCFQCQDDAGFWKILEQYMPDNSFICINSDLNVEEPSKKSVEDFTDELRAIVKLNGKVSRSKAYRKNVVPEAGKDVPYDKPVIILPIHFCERVVGYMGVWGEPGSKIELVRVIHFLLTLDVSGAKRLAD